MDPEIQKKFLRFFHVEYQSTSPSTQRNEKPVRTESYWEERMDRQSFMPRTEEEVDGSSLATSFLTIGDEIWNPFGA